MLTVHHLGISQSERVVWLCEELGLDYVLKRYDRDPVTRLAPADYRALHPLGTAPVITDGTIVLGETAAIFEYILARHGEGRLSVPPEAANFADYLFWFHFANGSLMPAQMIEMVCNRLGAKGDGAIMAALLHRVENGVAMCEARLADSPWFAGADFTAADIMIAFSFTTLRAFTPRDLAPLPAVRAWLQRIGERPAYRNAMAKCEPGFAPMLA